MHTVEGFYRAVLWDSVTRFRTYRASAQCPAHLKQQPCKGGGSQTNHNGRYLLRRREFWTVFYKSFSFYAPYSTGEINKHTKNVQVLYIVLSLFCKCWPMYCLCLRPYTYIQAADKPKRRRLGNSALEENNSFIHFSPYKVHLFVFLSHTPPSPLPPRKIVFCSKFFLIFLCLHVVTLQKKSPFIIIFWTFHLCSVCWDSSAESNILVKI
jgi:uncharacterized membrane protein YhaH (DUF805 family)